MSERCRYCESTVPTGSIICPSCGSYVVDVETRKSRLHLYLIPLSMVLLAAAVFTYLNNQAQMADEADNVVQIARPDPIKQQSEREARMEKTSSQRSRNIKKILADKRKAEEEAQALWAKMDDVEKGTFLLSQAKAASSRIETIRAAMGEGKLPASTEDALSDIEGRLAVGQVYVEQKQFAVAKGWYEGIHRELDDLLPEPEAE